MRVFTVMQINRTRIFTVDDDVSSRATPPYLLQNPYRLDDDQWYLPFLQWRHNRAGVFPQNTWEHFLGRPARYLDSRLRPHQEGSSGSRLHSKHPVLEPWSIQDWSLMISYLRYEPRSSSTLGNELFRLKNIWRGPLWTLSVVGL